MGRTCEECDDDEIDAHGDDRAAGEHCRGRLRRGAGQDHGRARAGQRRPPTAKCACFSGIPYAAPPVGGPAGRRRSRPRSGTASRRRRIGARCVQAPVFGDMVFAPRERGLPGRNVWTARERPTAKQPVMVWIYGGGFQGGSASEPRQDGDAPRVEGRRRRQPQLSPRPHRLPRASGADEGIAAQRVRQLRHPRSDRGAAVGAEEHRRVRRRSGQRHDLRRVGRLVLGQHPDGVAAGEGPVPQGHRRERRVVPVGTAAAARRSVAGVGGSRGREVRRRHERADDRGAARQAGDGPARRSRARRRAGSARSSTATSCRRRCRRSSPRASSTRCRCSPAGTRAKCASSVTLRPQKPTAESFKADLAKRFGASADAIAKAYGGATDAEALEAAAALASDSFISYGRGSGSRCTAPPAAPRSIATCSIARSRSSRAARRYGIAATPRTSARGTPARSSTSSACSTRSRA